MPAFSRGRGVKYDVELATEENPIDGALIGENIGRNVHLKGYCMVKTHAPAALLRMAHKELQDMDKAKRFQEMPNLVLDGLLGEEGSLRTAQMTPEDEGETTTEYKTIRRLDQMIAETAGVLCDSRSAQEFPFELAMKTPGLIHESGFLIEDPPEMTTEMGMKWLETFKWHRLMFVLFLGPRGGMLELQPFESGAGDSLRLITEAGMLVVFRADLLQRKWGSPGGTCWALSSFLLQSKSAVLNRAPPANPISLEFEAFVQERLENVIVEDQAEELNLDTGVRYQLEHNFRKLGVLKQQVAVRGIACKYTTTWDYDAFVKCLTVGADMAAEVPYTRWNHDQYYYDHPDCWKHFRVNIKHACFSEGQELFDAKHFRISPAETKGMDPMQRQILEVSYTALAHAGRTVKNLLQSLTGVYVGCHLSEWPMVDQGPEEAGGCEQRSAGTGMAGSIMSNRVSFIFGMNGPSVQFDTDASSAMACMEIGCVALDERKVNATMSSVTGICVILTPLTWIHKMGLGLMCAHGRAFCFDQCGGGWIKSEGGGSLALSNLLETVDDQRVVKSDAYTGTCAAIHINHAGNSGSFFAPSAPSLQKLMAHTCRMADVAPVSIDACEAHGEAQTMDDAVELSSIWKIYCDDAKPPLGVTSVRSNIGNHIQGASMCSMIKMLVLQNLGWQQPSQHLRQMNPQLPNASMDERSFINDEIVCFSERSSICTVTSIGFGGTMGHGVFYGARNELAPASEDDAVGKSLQFESIAFWPGGAADSEAKYKPQSDYHIVGSWSGWEESEPMEEESPGTYCYTLTLGANRFEEFYILYDQNPNQVLHPPSPGADSGARALGPSEEPAGRTWKVDARLFIQKEERRLPAASDDGKAYTFNEFTAFLGREAALFHWGIATPVEDPEPRQLQSTAGIGDTYRVRLSMNDKWQVVTWQWLGGPGHASPDGIAPLALTTSPAIQGKYYIRGDFNCWTIEEMAPREGQTGTFEFEVRLLRDGGCFQIVRNKDQFQVLHPSRPTRRANSWVPDVVGPDYTQPHSGLDYELFGKAGDVYRIEFQRDITGSVDASKITWVKVGEEPMSTEEKLDQKRSRFCIVGSWDHWRQPAEMIWNGKQYEYIVEIGKGGSETFQILWEGEWYSRLVPNMPDASPNDTHLVSDKEKYFDNSWAIGKHSSEMGFAGKAVEVMLKADTSGLGFKVKWELLDGPVPEKPKALLGRSAGSARKQDIEAEEEQVPSTRSVVPTEAVALTERDLIDE